MATAIREQANWWCKYCANQFRDTCLKDVPWYCSTPDCKYFEEPKPENAFVAGRRCGKTEMAKLMAKVLVETI